MDCVCLTNSFKRGQRAVYSSSEMKAVAVLVSCVAVIATAQADSLKADIAKANKAIHKAMMKGDMDALAKSMKAGMTSDFVYVENGQKQTADQMLQNMKMGMSQMGKITMADSKIMEVMEKGNTGTSKTKHMMSSSMKGPDKKTHKMAFTGVSHDSYVKKNGKWMMSKMVWVSQTTTLDGKPMDMSKMGG